MKYFTLILLVALIGCGTVTQQVPVNDYSKGGHFIEMGTGRVVFYALDGRVVELIGVKIPKASRPGHMLARNFFHHLTKNRRIMLKYDIKKFTDHSLLAYVYVGDVFVNAEMIRKGYAYAEPTLSNNRHDIEFAELEAKAKSEGHGIWKDGGDTLF